MSEQITQEMIDAWKLKFGRVKKLTLDGVTYYYRPLNTDEYLNIQKLLGADENAKPEVLTAKTGVIEPTLADSAPAGVILTLSDEVLKMSGFVPDAPAEEL